VFEDGFGDTARSVRDRVHGHELGLHVGREARVFRGTERDRLRAAIHARADAVAFDGQLYAHLAQLVDARVEDVRAGAGDADVAARRRDGAQERGRFDAVGNDRVLGAGQALDALD